MSEKQEFSKGILYILIANIINLSFNLLSTFLMPKFLSTNTYAEIKTYTLYLSYAGLLHFGYADGMYLKYGGKNISTLDKQELNSDLSTMRIFQFFISCSVLLISIIIRNPIGSVFAISVLPYNMESYFKSLYQAVGQFRLYGKILNITSMLLFGINMTLLFVLHTDNYLYYLVGSLCVYILVWVMLELNATRIFGIHFHCRFFSIKTFVANIKSGILLMLGAFSSIILTSMDRLFVKIFFTNLEFAQYSLAVSAETFLDVAISPITVTMYNFFCKCKDHNKIKRIKRYVLIFSSLIISTGFAINFIIDHWISKYINSKRVLVILFSSQIYFVIIRSIYVNLYKARKRQKQYFTRLIFIIALGVFTNYAVYKLWGVKDAFAIATLFCAMVWFIFCQIDVKDQRFDIFELLYLLLENINFLLIGIYFKPAIGFALYIIITITLALILMKKDFLGMLRYFREIIIRKAKGIERG